MALLLAAGLRNTVEIGIGKTAAFLRMDHNHVIRRRQLYLWQFLQWTSNLKLNHLLIEYPSFEEQTLKEDAIKEYV